MISARRLLGIITIDLLSMKERFFLKSAVLSYSLFFFYNVWRMLKKIWKSQYLRGFFKKTSFIFYWWMLCVNWQFWLEKYFLHNLSLRWVARVFVARVLLIQCVCHSRKKNSNFTKSGSGTEPIILTGLRKLTVASQSEGAGGWEQDTNHGTQPRVNRRDHPANMHRHQAATVEQQQWTEQSEWQTQVSTRWDQWDWLEWSWTQVSVINWIPERGRGRETEERQKRQS